MREPLVYDPRVLRMLASSIPLDVLVCSDPRVAADARPLFADVHLLDPSGLGVSGHYKELVEEHGLVLHAGPPGPELESIAAELTGMRVAYVFGPDFGLSAIRGLPEGSVLLSGSSPRSAALGEMPLPPGNVLIDLGDGFAIAPELLADVLAPICADRHVVPGGPLSGDLPEADIEELDAEQLREELRRSNRIVGHLQARTRDLEQQVGDLHFELEQGRRRPLGGKLGRGLRRIRARTRPLLGTRLGLLWHHHPKPLKVPDRYRETEPPQPAPSISVVVPSYNQAQWVGHTVESLLDQEYPALEVIVQDGGSSDETTKVLSAYEDRLAYVESTPDGGQADAVNKGFMHANGEIMAWLNSDDLLLPGSLAYVASYFAAHPDVDVVYGHRVLIDEEGREIGRWAMPEHDDDVLSWADYVPQETMFWRREIWERAGGRVDDSFRFALDWDLLLRFRDAGAKIVRLPRYLGAFRIHAEQKSSAQVSTVGRGEMDRLRNRANGRRVTPQETANAIKPYLRRHRRIDRLQRLHLVRH
jgi:GT2 family glycosyltransferase